MGVGFVNWAGMSLKAEVELSWLSKDGRDWEVSQWSALSHRGKRLQSGEEF